MAGSGSKRVVGRNARPSEGEELVWKMVGGLVRVLIGGDAGRTGRWR